MRKYFGTDGVRGVANTELTNDLAYKLGRAGAYVLAKGKENIKVVIGKDTRISGDMLESALIAGMMSVGANVVCVGVVPTPAVAYLTKLYNADCGVVISASHNPVEYNGIKFFNKKGYKLDDSIEIEIEQLIEDMNKIEYNPTGENVGTKADKKDAIRDYIDYLKTIIDVDFNNLKVVLDCANGAAHEAAPIVFKELGADVITINNNPNGCNINLNCGSTHPKSLQEEVVKNSADIGLAYDGDADRLIAVDEKGNTVDGDYILAICAKFLKEQGKLKNDTLVVTVMSNIGLHIASKENNINTISTKVGDRYVLEEMIKEGYNLGGEQSGHMIFLDYITTGDGILSSLFLSNVLVSEEKTLSDICGIMSKYPQVLINAKVKNENKDMYIKDEQIIEEINKIEEILDGEGRVLIRPSGTEPLVRVMLEGKEEGQLHRLASELANLIESKLS